MLVKARCKRGVVDVDDLRVGKSALAAAMVCDPHPPYGLRRHLDRDSRPFLE